MERAVWGTLAEPVAAETQRMKLERAEHNAQLINETEAGHKKML